MYSLRFASFPVSVAHSPWVLQIVMTLSFTLVNYWMVGFRNDLDAFLLHNVLLYLIYQVLMAVLSACIASYTHPCHSYHAVRIWNESSSS